MVIKIATLNLCLGLPNKKNIVKQMIINEHIDLLLMQETEVDISLDPDLLSFPGYNYESECVKNVKARVGCYVKSNLNYIRRTDLEGTNLHLLVIDIKSEHDLRIINIYRSFNPLVMTNARELFKTQLSLIKQAMTSNTILLGDFNLE